MTKRDAPESGFEIANPSKRQAYNGSGDSIHSNPPSNPLSRNSNGAPIQPPPSSTAPDDSVGDDAFLPDNQPAQAGDYEDQFVPSDTQRTELAREASDLQAKPSSAINELFDSNIPDDQSQGEDSALDQSTPSSSPATRARRTRSRFRSKRKKRYRYQPRLWSEGAPDEEAMFTARRSDHLICGTTDIILDTEPLCVHGTVWEEIQAEELLDLLQSENYVPLSPAQDKFDFLKACFRLGSLVEPNRMSRLLGGKHRTPEYCAFLLQGFYGLLNNPKVRRVLKGNAAERPPEQHRDVVVYGDQLYPSDDEILGSQENEPADPEEDHLLQEGRDDVIVIEESDREEDEGHRDPPHARRSAVHEITHKDSTEQQFLARPSYIVRNYLSIVTGQHVNDMSDFQAYCEEVGITFLTDPRRQPLGRLKWLTEKMPAPELGPKRTVSQPMELWKHAMKTYSVRNLTRCALVEVDPLLDWLCFVANEAEPATSEAEYFRTKLPVVAIAPVPLLYLADKVADAVLRVLSIAVQTEELNLDTEGDAVAHLIIDREEVLGATQYLERYEIGQPRNYPLLEIDVLGNEQSYNRQWPALIQRPLTSSERITLCDRTPKVSISIPNSITDEMRAVLMSFRIYVKRKLYVNHKMLENKDPLAYMSGKEKKQNVNKRREINRVVGINWSRDVTREAGEVGEDEDAEDPPASQQQQAAIQISPGKEGGSREERNTGAVPLACGVVAEEDRSTAAKTESKRAERLPKFFDQVNFAELLAFRLGSDELQKRKQNALDRRDEEELRELFNDAALFLREAISKKQKSVSTVCIYRLGWICLHALGIAVDKDLDNAQPMGYASSTNYTNFGQLRSRNPVFLTTDALYSLTKIADVVVREEADVLMACAAHDDGRPWIDKSDVALVSSIRKEEFRYRGL